MIFQLYIWISFVCICSKESMEEDISILQSKKNIICKQIQANIHNTRIQVISNSVWKQPLHVGSVGLLGKELWVSLAGASLLCEHVRVCFLQARTNSSRHCLWQLTPQSAKQTHSLPPDLLKVFKQHKRRPMLVLISDHVVKSKKKSSWFHFVCFSSI